jgi:hypothetical protein
MAFSVMFTFLLYIILKGKHCQRPIAVVGVVDHLGPGAALSVIQGTWESLGQQALPTSDFKIPYLLTVLLSIPFNY